MCAQRSRHLLLNKAKPLRSRGDTPTINNHYTDYTLTAWLIRDNPSVLTTVSSHRWCMQAPFHPGPTPNHLKTALLKGFSSNRSPRTDVTGLLMTIGFETDWLNGDCDPQGFTVPTKNAKTHLRSDTVGNLGFQHFYLFSLPRSNSIRRNIINRTPNLLV